MAIQGQEAFAFLLIIPVVWVIWLWVHSALLSQKYSNPLFPADDRLKTRHSGPLLPDILQLSRNVLLRGRSQLSG